MATGVEPGWPRATARGHASADEPVATLGHFLEPECSADQDLFGNLLGQLNIGLTYRMTLLQRIFARTEVDRSSPVLNGKHCRLWTGPHSGSGRGGDYGRFSFEGVTAAVHRVVYQICYGPIPPRKQVDHACNTRLCCEPAHLQRTTHKRNQKLRDQRRRSK